MSTFPHAPLPGVPDLTALHMSHTGPKNAAGRGLGAGLLICSEETDLGVRPYQLK